MFRIINFLILIFLIFIPLTFAKQRIYAEKVYQMQWCKAHNGKLEHKLNDKARVDCLTDKFAVEFDFANKWVECIGQALYYGRATRKQPACVLIMENWEKDLKYLRRLRKTAYKKGISLRTFTIKPEQIKK